VVSGGLVEVLSLQRLDVVTSIEALFRTLKYWPEYSISGFASIEDARAWVARFVDHYNNDHQHSGIGFVSPADRHDGNDIAILADRRAVHARAQKLHPERWSKNPHPWTRSLTVTLNPEVDRRAALAV